MLRTFLRLTLPILPSPCRLLPIRKWSRDFDMYLSGNNISSNPSSLPRNTLKLFEDQNMFHPITYLDNFTIPPDSTPTVMVKRTIIHSFIKYYCTLDNTSACECFDFFSNISTRRSFVSFRITYYLDIFYLLLPRKETISLLPDYFAAKIGQRLISKCKNNKLIMK